MDTELPVGWARYEKVKDIGHGSYGAVILARDLADDGEPVAIKCVNLSGIDEREMKLAMGEVAILRHLSHPNVLRFIDCFVDEDSTLCTVTEFVDGGDLSAMLRHARGEAPLGASGADSAAASPSPVQRFIDALIIADVAEQLLHGLAYLHANNVLHRDLKPANVYVTRGGQVKIGDFGVAKLLSVSTPNAGTFIGTPFYVAPELAMGEPYSFSADVWAVGVLLYELYTGKLPFTAGNVLALINVITEGRYDEGALTQ